MSDRWINIGAVPPTTLTDARLQLHWAAQAVAAVGHHLLEPRPDDSQSNLGWDDATESLLGHAVQGELRAGLRPSDLTLVLVDAHGGVARDLPLNRRTLDEGLRFLADKIAELSGRPLSKPLAARDYDMPDHPTGRGAPFSIDDGAPFLELANWFANAHHAITAAVSAHANAAPVRCWPHHFDIASLIVLDPDRDAGSARSIGVGMSPGDAAYHEPYFYVNPWPQPDGPTLPNLPSGGHWHTAGWLGAVLSASVLVEGDPARQYRRVSEFLDAAIQANVKLLRR